MAFNAAFGDKAEIVETVICGDSYFNENLETATREVLDLIKGFNPDLVIAGPAFNAGRYGMACGTVASTVEKELGIPAITGMYIENPGVDSFKKDIYIISTKSSAAGMRDAVKVMAPFALKLAAGEEIGASVEEGYIPNGFGSISSRKSGDLSGQWICCLPKWRENLIPRNSLCLILIGLNPDLQ